MKRLIVMLLTGGAAFLTGCLVTSVYPFYQQKDLAFEPALLGGWSNSKEAGEHWKFERESTNAYKFTYTSDGKDSVMRAHFFKLGENSFLDMFTTEESGNSEPPPIPSHFLIRVFQVTPSPKLAALNYDWLKDLLNKEPNSLRHHVIADKDKPEDNRLILTADTAELQKFILKHLKTESAWKGDFQLNRDSSDAKAEPGKATDSK